MPPKAAIGNPSEKELRIKAEEFRNTFSFSKS